MGDGCLHGGEVALTVAPKADVAQAPTSGTAVLMDAAVLSAAAVVIGVVCGLLSVLVRLLIAIATNVFFHQSLEPEFIPPIQTDLGPWLVLVPAVGGLAAGLIVYGLSGDTRIRGVSDVVESVAHKEGKLRARSLSGHALATCVSVGSGGSAGREGAIVQLGAASGLLLSRLFGSSVRHRKILLAAGAAGAISGTFNTPIAGIIFAIEVVLLEFTTRSFVPIAIASVFSVAVATHFLGDHPAFPVPAYELVSAWELGLYVVLGLMAGATSIAILRTLNLSDRVFSRMPVPHYGRPVVGGLAVGLVAIAVPEVLGVGYEHVQLALTGDFAVRTLLMILVAKLVAFALTRGSGGASGAFSPSLFMGAMLGGAFGAVVHEFFPTVTATSGAYALVGMAAVYAAVTRASLTAIVMLFEMTHNFSIILPLILTVVVADVLAKAYGEATIYTLKAKQRGGHIEHDMTMNVLDRVTVEEIMTRDVVTVPEDAKVREVVDLRFRTGHQGYPVVNAQGRLTGIITSTDLRKKVGDDDLDRRVDGFMTRGRLATVTPHDSAHHALTSMVQHDIGHLLVVDEDNPGRLVGFLTRTDVVNVERRVLDEEKEQSSLLAPLFRMVSERP